MARVLLRMFFTWPDKPSSGEPGAPLERIGVQRAKLSLRGVADSERLPPSATAVAEPNLEESYIAFMAARGRTSATRQDDETLPEAVETQVETTVEKEKAK